MTSIRKLASALCLATFCSFSNAQTVDSTGNLINNNSWSGVGAYANDPNDCCSNPAGSQPLYDISSGTIKWSYGYATVQQSIGIQSALSAAGTGLLVQGYNYSFEAKNLSQNGLGFDSFGYNTWLTNSAGQTLLGDSANLTMPFDWTTFSGNLSLSTGLPLPEAGTAGISFYGRDDGYWAGLYGPEVRNVSFSINYSIDPCASDPLYSPSCSGYTQALLASLPVIAETPTVEVAPVVQETTPVQEVVATIAPTVTPTETTSSEPAASSSPAPVATVTETSAERSSRPGVSTSQILSIIANEQSRLSSVERNTVDASVQQATREAERATSQAETIAVTSASSSASESITGSAAQTIQLESFSASSSGQQDLGTGLVVSINPSMPQQFNSQSSAFAQQDSFANEATRVDSSSTSEQATSLTSVTSIENLTENKQQPVEETQQQSEQSTVKRNVPNNELAGAVTLASYAVAPPGFDAYFGSLTDSPFYAPKEIYKNQKNVDNARILRQLSGASDKVHAEMVDQQYGR